jgi:hypothetical protein
MSYRTFLLALHIASVAAWLGANYVQAVLSPRFAKESPAVAAAWTRQQMWLGQRYYNAAGALIAITGVLLVLDGPWDWSDGFVWVGIGVLVVGGALGGLAFTPLARQRLAGLESGDLASAEAAQSRIIPLAVLDTVLVLTAVVAMVHKWGV